MHAVDVEALRTALLRQRWPHRRAGYVYRGGGDLLLRHGQLFNGRQLPKRYEQHRGPTGCCYRNAATAANAEPTLRYCEGFYVRTLTDADDPATRHVARGHAWCLDRRDRIVEVTRPPGPDAAVWCYWGCVFDPGLVLEYFDRLGVHSAPLFLNAGTGAGAQIGAPGIRVVADDRTDWPILRLPYEPERRSLPESLWDGLRPINTAPPPLSLAEQLLRAVPRSLELDAADLRLSPVKE